MKYLISLILLSLGSTIFADASLNQETAEYSESVYYVNAQGGNDSWQGISPVCAAPYGPKKTITAAINVSANEDLIVIYPGTYNENIVINSKNLALTGTNAHDSGTIADTIIDGGYHDSTVKTINANCLFKGLTIKNGKGLNGGGIYASGGYLKVKKCIISNNTTLNGYGFTGQSQEGFIDRYVAEAIENQSANGGDGGGIYCDNALIEDSNISNNTTGKGADDFTLPYDPGNGGNGAGIFCNGQVQINNCVLSKNHCGKGGEKRSDGTSAGKGGNGGAIFISPISSTTITNTEIKENIAGDAGNLPFELGAGGDGGGFYSQGITAITNSTITLNRSGEGHDGGFGGGGFFNSISDVNMTDCVISQNYTTIGRFSGPSGGGSGGSGGGIWCASETAYFQNCDFIDNYTGNGGSGDYGCSGGDGGFGGGICIISNSQLRMNKCKFIGNRTGFGNGGYISPGGDGGSGGAIYCDSNSAVFSDCLIKDNVTGYGGTGSGESYYIGGNGGSGAGIYLTGDTGLIANCLIFNNITGKGGDGYQIESETTQAGNGGNGAAIYCTNSVIKNCSIISNLTGAKGTAAQGGIDGINGKAAIYCDTNSVIANSIVWNESIEQFAGQNSNNITYCDILDSNFAGTNGNIFSNPLFVNPDANNFHLLTSSPCIDAGDNDSVPAGITTDMDGFARFYDAPFTPDAGNGTAPIVDIGAYEFQQSIYNQTRSTYHDTIQQAVDAAQEDDKIFIRPSIYSGTGNCDIDFGGKNIELHATGENTIIDCMGTRENPHRGFKFTNNETAASLINGFTIINGFGPDEIWEDAYSSGGAIYCNDASPTITNCTFIDNLSDYFGGAICSYYCYANISNCTFQNCDSQYGGAIYNYSSSLTMSHCLFNNNTAASCGGAAFDSSGYPVFNNCTFYNNQASIEGSAICNHDSDSHIKNSIVWNNFEPAMQPISNNIGYIDVRYCDILGGYSGIANFSAEPYFANPALNDFHLKSQYGRWNEQQQQWVNDDITSPCIDAGDSSNVRDELWPHGKILNIGIYGGTSQASMSGSSVGNIADFDNNGSVGNLDLLLFAQAWLKNENLVPEDTTRDGKINLNDFAIFANNWLWQNPSPHE